MSPNYQMIVDDVCKAIGLYEACSEVAKRCEALANKPVCELTDAEIRDAYDDGYCKLHEHVYAGIRRVIAAHIAKQSEPEEIPFSQEKLDEGGWMVKVELLSPNSYNEKIIDLKIFDDATKVTLVRKS